MTHIEELQARIAQLERERDELCDKLELISTDNTAHGYALSALRAECGLDRNGTLYSDIAVAFNQMKRERDEAQAKCERYKKALREVASMTKYWPPEFALPDIRKTIKQALEEK